MLRQVTQCKKGDVDGRPRFSVNKRNGDGSEETKPLPIRQLELTGAH